MSQKLEKVRKGANSFMDSKAGDSVPGGATPDLGGGGVGKQIFEFFRGVGFSANQAAAWVGNFQQESGLNPAIVQPGGEGHGLAQWGVEDLRPSSLLLRTETNLGLILRRSLISSCMNCVGQKALRMVPLEVQRLWLVL